MPRNPNNPNEFIAGALQKVTIDKKEYFVDGRLKELRNVNDFMDRLTLDEAIKKKLTDNVKKIIGFEFFGE